MKVGEKVSELWALLIYNKMWVSKLMECEVHLLKNTLNEIRLLIGIKMNTKFGQIATRRMIQLIKLLHSQRPEQTRRKLV